MGCKEVSSNSGNELAKAYGSTTQRIFVVGLDRKVQLSGSKRVLDYESESNSTLNVVSYSNLGFASNSYTTPFVSILSIGLLLLFHRGCRWKYESNEESEMQGSEHTTCEEDFVRETNIDSIYSCVPP